MSLRGFRFAQLSVICLLSLGNLWAAEPSTGPTSSAEESILVKKVRELYTAEKFKDAIIPLQRLIERYPARPDAATYREFRAWLGHSYLATGQAGRAIAPLRAYLEGAAAKPLDAQVHLWLAESYLRLGKFHQALLTADEISNRSDAQLLRARALIHLNQDKDAALAIDLADKAGSPLGGGISVLRLQLKTRQCELFAKNKKLNEEQASDQISRRGGCLAEALPTYRATLDKHDDAASEEAQNIMKASYAAYARACSRSPEPTKKKDDEGKRLSEKERKQYKAELSEYLQAQCRTQLELSESILQGWTSDSDSVVRARVEELLKEIKK